MCIKIFKIAVNEGLTIFNLVDGIVDEFNNESGIDTAENVTSLFVIFKVIQKEEKRRGKKE